MSYTLVKINDDSLKIRMIYDDKYLVGLENFLVTTGLGSHLFVTPTHVGGEYDVLVQCDVVQALRNLWAKWKQNPIGVEDVPKGVYVKDGDWFVDAAVGDWIIPSRELVALKTLKNSTFNIPATGGFIDPDQIALEVSRTVGKNQRELREKYFGHSDE